MYYISYQSFIVHMGEFLSLIGDKLPTFVGIKFTSANLEEGLQALHADNKKYIVFLGNDHVRIILLHF